MNMHTAKLGKNVEAIDRSITTDFLINEELYRLGVLIGVEEHNLDAALDLDEETDNARGRLGYGDILIFQEWGPKDGAQFMKLSEFLVKIVRRMAG